MPTRPPCANTPTTRSSPASSPRRAAGRPLFRHHGRLYAAAGGHAGDGASAGRGAEPPGRADAPRFCWNEGLKFDLEPGFNPAVVDAAPPQPRDQRDYRRAVRPRPDHRPRRRRRKLGRRYRTARRRLGDRLLIPLFPSSPKTPTRRNRFGHAGLFFSISSPSQGELSPQRTEGLPLGSFRRPQSG